MRPITPAEIEAAIAREGLEALSLEELARKRRAFELAAAGRYAVVVQEACSEVRRRRLGIPSKGNPYVD